MMEEYWGGYAETQPKQTVYVSNIEDDKKKAATAAEPADEAESETVALRQPLKVQKRFKPR